MSKRAPDVLLDDVLQCSANIFEYTEGMTYQEFIIDRKTFDAVVRNLEIIGEAANRLPDSYKAKIDTVDWHKIRGLRNRIVHHYSGIDEQIIWSVKQEYLPELVAQIKNYLNQI